MSSTGRPPAPSGMSSAEERGTKKKGDKRKRTKKKIIKEVLFYSYENV
jgi:hypothetical protein